MSRGSSPLARGLHDHECGGAGVGGIIPARAGFTRPTTAGVFFSSDHPRSRGVYPVSPSSRAGAEGSSPLARGLRGGVHRPGDRRRIIPARAGFTPPSGPRRTRPRDHPRSRGVYRSASGSPRTSWGSSPLARGLPRLHPGIGGDARIIPARAGFTRSRARAPICPQDHPRSRGVYVIVQWFREQDAGSSPLARGLPRPARPASCMTGIIPARAGFTRARRLAGHGREDHPRSRGVYPTGRIRRPRMSGSSPLARGLPSTTTAAHASRRIIPARAGFTLDDDGSACIEADHPRSRGVYTGSPPTSTATGGSSPLARGLPPGGSRHHATRRIIPARAGFTTAPGCRSPRAWDHPRSRGVYPARPGCQSPGGGSSPLARGLRREHRRPSKETRIIPARAGFTTRRRPRSPRRGGSSPLARGLLQPVLSAVWTGRIIPARAGFTAAGPLRSMDREDHPRSRGVYSSDREAGTLPRGSSPLARGLLIATLGEAIDVRIIPARAGFTGRRGRRRRPCRDHPRSRGVYSADAHHRHYQSGSSPLARGLLG